MRTNIKFVDKNENILMSIEYVANPIDTYKIGDKIYLEIDTIIYPRTKENLRKKYSENFVWSIIDNHKEDCQKLNKRFKIVSKFISINKSINNDYLYSQTIEYCVKECEKFYLKWWYIKYLLKKLTKKQKNVKKIVY